MDVENGHAGAPPNANTAVRVKTRIIKELHSMVVQAFLSALLDGFLEWEEMVEHGDVSRWDIHRIALTRIETLGHIVVNYAIVELYG
jgi:hypothetical protein